MHFENILVKNLFKSYFVKRKDRSVSFHSSISEISDATRE